jgi:8-oxo-dGTP diphosphatase
MKSLVSKLYRHIPPAVTRIGLRVFNAGFNVSVAGMFLDDEGKVLLLRHVYRHRYPWGLPGGFLTRNETPETGAVRELEEETGLIAAVERVAAVNVIGPGHLEVVVAGRVDGRQPVRLSHEIFEARFFSPSDLPLDLPPEHRRRIGEFCGPGRP